MEGQLARAAVLYATQTGTAQAMALDVAEHLSANGVAAVACAVDEYALERLSDAGTLVVWIAATTGAGVPPTSFAAVWRRLLARALTEAQPLLGRRHVVLGLGDSSYTHYNVVARRLSARLQQLGAAQDVLALQLVDAAAVGGPWPQYVHWRGLLLARCAPAPLRSVAPVPPSPYRVDENCGAGPDEAQPGDLCALELNARVTAPAHWHEVRRVRVAVAGVQPGEVVYVWPANTGRVDGQLPRVALPPADEGMLHRSADESVDSWLLRHGLEPARRVRVWGNAPAAWWHGRALALRTWMSWVFDPWAPAQPYFAVRVAAHYSSQRSDPARAERLADMGRNPFSAGVCAWALDERRTASEVLEELACRGCDVPLALLLSALPLHQPRPYSVASVEPGHCSLLVAVAQRRTPLGRLREGRVGATLRCSPPLLRVAIAPGPAPLAALAAWHARPGLLVTAGTGVAGVASLAAGPRPQWTLYHGCRDAALDGLELLCPELTTQDRRATWVAQSRVSGAAHRYVWHALLADSAHVHATLWAQDGFAAVVGSSRMARDVLSALATVVRLHGASNMELEAARDAVQLLVQRGRIVLDVWD